MGGMQPQTWLICFRLWEREDSQNCGWQLACSTETWADTLFIPLGSFLGFPACCGNAVLLPGTPHQTSFPSLVRRVKTRRSCGGRKQYADKQVVLKLRQNILFWFIHPGSSWLLFRAICARHFLMLEASVRCYSAAFWTATRNHLAFHRTRFRFPFNTGAAGSYIWFGGASFKPSLIPAF
jgi:hypothetical protein